MPKNTIDLYYESKCVECGGYLLGQTDMDFTLDSDTKERIDGYNHLDADHVCDFSEHRELDESITQTVDY